jgi:hypothetical protein
MSAWLTDIRKTALVAALASVVGSVLPLRTTLQTTLQTATATLTRIPWFFYPLLGIGTMFVAAVTLGFLIVLYRSKVELRIPSHLRHLALFAAAATALDLLWYLLRWVQSLQFLSQFQQPSAGSVIAFILTLLAQVAYILFLVAIFRHTNNALRSHTDDDRFLRWVTKISVLFWSLVLVGIVGATIYVVFDYPYYLGLDHQVGSEIPSLGSEVLGRGRTFLQMACLMVPSYIVHRSLRLNHGSVEVPAVSP